MYGVVTITIAKTIGLTIGVVIVMLFWLLVLLRLMTFISRWNWCVTGNLYHLRIKYVKPKQVQKHCVATTC